MEVSSEQIARDYLYTRFQSVETLIGNIVISVLRQLVYDVLYERMSGILLILNRSGPIQVQINIGFVHGNQSDMGTLGDNISHDFNYCFSIVGFRMPILYAVV